MFFVVLVPGCGGAQEGEHQVITIGGEEKKAIEADLAEQQKMNEQMLPPAKK